MSLKEEDRKLSLLLNWKRLIKHFSSWIFNYRQDYGIWQPIVSTIPSFMQ